MKFRYTAVQQDGKKVLGETEANSSTDALLFLTGKGLTPVTLDAVSGASKWDAFFGESITITDQIFLTRYLSLMLKVGADLSRVIDVLIADFDKPSLKAFLIEVRSSLEAGQPFYGAFARYPQFFSPVFINLVKAGERSGNLDIVFDNLSTALDREREFRGRITSALVYPGFILGLAFVVTTFLVTFALPRLSGFFSTSNVQPPTFSRVVFAIGGFLNAHIIVLGIFAIVIVGGLWYALRFTLGGRAMLFRFFATLPIVSTVYRNISLQYFASTLASLMKSGLPILEALRITSDVVSFPGMRDALLRIANEGVARGSHLGAAFRKEAVFPSVVSNLVAISEQAGHIEDVLATLANFYESEVDVSLKRLVSFVEPVLLLVIGTLVGTIALAVILPIYQLVAGF